MGECVGKHVQACGRMFERVGVCRGVCWSMWERVGHIGERVGARGGTGTSAVGAGDELLGAAGFLRAA